MKLREKTVHEDYRDNIIIDRDNPILTVKANRDRYTQSQKKYAGLPQIGSIYSEDALTWNVFRTLDITNQLSILNGLFEDDLDDSQLLIWILAFNDKSKQLQWNVGSLIRSIDGKYAGQITEPDIIISTKRRIYIIEAKLGHSIKYPQHLWESSKSEGPDKRYGSYTCKPNPFVDFPKDDVFYYKHAYQLFRMGFYAYKLGRILNKEPVLVSLANKLWWKSSNKTHASAEWIWEEFLTKYIAGTTLVCKSIFWQGIHTEIKKGYGLTKLDEYLNTHPSFR